MRTNEEIMEYVLKSTVDMQMVYDTYTPEQKECFHLNVNKAIYETLEAKDKECEERVMLEVKEMKTSLKLDGFLLKEVHDSIVKDAVEAERERIISLAGGEPYIYVQDIKDQNSSAT